MKLIARHSDNKAAFTIIELLTVMSVIIILIGLLVPGLNMLKRYARNVAQRNQFHAIGVALEAFNAEQGAYPQSDPGSAGLPCGAAALAMAMVGIDLLGYDVHGDYTQTDLSDRILYMSVGDARANRVGDLYASLSPAFAGAEYVLCDIYQRVEHRYTGNLVGMPVLYYRANTSRQLHNWTTPSESIYNYLHNDDLVLLGIPWANTTAAHPMASAGVTWHADNAGNPIPADPNIFYDNARNWDIPIRWPQRPDSYILLSAGYDGEYGTRDDILNFSQPLMRGPE